MSSPGQPDGHAGRYGSPPAAGQQQPGAAAAAAAGPPPAAPPAAPDWEQEEEEVDADEQWFSEEDDEIDGDQPFEDWLEQDVDVEDEDWEAMEEMEEDEDVDEEMEELLDDSGSSDDGGEDEERVAAETSGRHVHGDWAGYAIPTVSHHFQSADALSVVQLPASAGGGVLAATFDGDGVAAWLLPGAGCMQALGPAAQPAAHRLGGFQAPRDIYSMSLSPCGRWIATGGEGGLLCLYSLDPAAPPRRPVGGRRPQLQGLNYLFTPHKPLGSLMEHVVQHAPQSMQSLAATVLSNPAAHSLTLALADAVRSGPGGVQLPPQQQQLLEHALSTLFTHTMHGDIHDLAVEAAQGVVEEQLEVLRQTGQALTAAAHTLREQLAAGDSDAQEQLALLQDRLADNAAAQHHAGKRLQLLALRLGPQAMRNTAALAGMRADRRQEPEEPLGGGVQPADAQDGRAGKQPAAPAGQQAQQQAQQQQAEGVPPAALVLRGIFSLGLEPAQVQRIPFLSDGMTNGVRWGLVAGRLCLLAADQSQYVYIFERPDPSPAADAASSSSGGGGSGDLRPEHMLCMGLGEASPHWCMRPINFFRAQQHLMGARVSQQLPPADAPEPPAPGAAADAPQAGAPARSQRAAAAAASAAWAPLARAAAGRSIGRASPYMTAALGPFPVPCNLAAASPDGRWVAVAGDSQCVFLCDQAAGFAWRQLPYDLAGPRDDVEEGLEAGAQYIAWNASSTLLAVSSDALHAVFVFEPHSGRLVLRVEGHRRPCLCVGFAPWDDRLLVYSEESKHVHLRRVPQESEAAAGASGGGDGADEQGSQQGAAPPAALFEQNARDDLADARQGYQLLRLPVLPQDPAPQLPIGASTRRRRVNGMALTPEGDVLLATKQGKILRFLSSQPWSPHQHAAWPPAFKAATRTLLCCAHRQPPAGAGVGVWSLPLPLLQHIVELVAGSRMDWLGRETTQAEQQEGHAASGSMAPAGGGGNGSGGGATPPPGVSASGACADFCG